MSSVITGPRCNRRVTCDTSPSNDRSESALAVNPRDPYNMVGASKRFTNPSTYAFSLAAYATFDGGQSWTEAPPLALLSDPDPNKVWAGVSDPAVAWDNTGNVYLVALPFPGPGSPYNTLGIAVYKSADGGRTWSAPNFIHPNSPNDDKQSAAGDGNPASPHYGNVYAAWDNGSQLAFARTTDHGVTWKGVGANPIGRGLDTVVLDSFAPEIAVAQDGTLYIVWVNGEEIGDTIKIVKSIDGGETFSSPQVVASSISPLKSPPLPRPGSFPELPGGHFRVLTLPAVCAGAGTNVVVAWADYRENVSRIYYRHSTNGGTSWLGPASGQPLLTGAAVSLANVHDFHPQLASTPIGEIGCAFYEFGPTGGGEFPPNLINAILVVSTDNGATFPNRALVTDQPWDPTVDAPLSHGDPTTTFIGEYFGLAASRLGFFPFWTDTRTGVQEIFTTRLAVNPADIYIRDSSSDVGDVPSPGNHWEAPDLIVRRQPDGDVTFVNEDLLRNGVTDHYVYARVTNRGPNPARSVRLSVIVGNYPSLQALPGSEFRYPQDWYAGDWTIQTVIDNHLVLGESTPINIPNGATRIIGPVVWPAAQIPSHATWHPCLLAEARADNDDSAGGQNGCDIQVSPGTCDYGAYFWGNNNICQRNLSYATVPASVAASIVLPFLVGSMWGNARFLEVIVEKGRELAEVPMKLRMEPVHLPDTHPARVCHPGEIVLVDECRVVVRVDNCEVGEIIAAPGTVWRPICPSPPTAVEPETCHGGEGVGEKEWQLNQPRAGVGFAVEPGAMRRMTLSFLTPNSLKPGTRTQVYVFQRNDRQIITGSVILELQVEADLITKPARSVEASPEARRSLSKARPRRR